MAPDPSPHRQSSMELTCCQKHGFGSLGCCVALQISWSCILHVATESKSSRILKTHLLLHSHSGVSNKADPKQALIYHDLHYEDFLEGAPSFGKIHGLGFLQKPRSMPGSALGRSSASETSCVRRGSSFYSEPDRPRKHKDPNITCSIQYTVYSIWKMVFGI